MVVVHRTDDALIPPGFTSVPYVEAARDRGLVIEFRLVPGAQHFDAFLSLPAMAGHAPLLPSVWQSLQTRIAPTQARSNTSVRH